jgi:hypothetical protein
MDFVETCLSRFSVTILKNDYSTMFLTINMINLNVPSHDSVDFSIMTNSISCRLSTLSGLTECLINTIQCNAVSYVERWLHFHNL